MKNLPPLFCLLLLTIGCSNTSHTSNSVARATHKSYSPDLLGQLERIKDEGTNEESLRQNIAHTDTTISYELVKKNPAKYAGEAWHCRGKILEIAEKDGKTAARLDVDDSSKPMYLLGNMETPFVEGDDVVVIGYLAGEHSYTSQANWNISIPALAVRAMLRPDELSKYQKAPKATKLPSRSPLSASP
jgi:hypothetical protein